MSFITLANRLISSAEKNSNSSAIIYNDIILNYGDLLSRANGLAKLLDEKIAPSSPVGIFCQGNPTSLIAIFATIISGRSYVPLNPKFPDDRINKIIELSKIGAIICDKNT